MRDKMIQIYEAMADMTLEMINKSSGNVLYLGKDELEMVHATQSLYETINCTNQSTVTVASESSIPENNKKSQCGCNYTDRPDTK